MAVKLNQADLELVLRYIKISMDHSSGSPPAEIYVDADGSVVLSGTEGTILATLDPHDPYAGVDDLVEGPGYRDPADEAVPWLLEAGSIHDGDGKPSVAPDEAVPVLFDIWLTLFGRFFDCGPQFGISIPPDLARPDLASTSPPESFADRPTVPARV